jgi:hypothetical protein
VVLIVLLFFKNKDFKSGFWTSRFVLILNGIVSLSIYILCFKKLSLIIDYTHYTYLYIRQKKSMREIGSIWLELLTFLYFEVNWQIRIYVFFLHVFGEKKSTKILPELIKLRRKVWEFDFNSEKVKTTYNVLNAAIF